jgi:hypothetical protein
MFPLAAAFAANTTAARHAVAASRPAGASARRGAPEVMGELPCACLAEEIETPGRGPACGR